MTLYVLSPRAQTDIDEIWEYTAKQWSPMQTDRYLRLIRSTIETAAGHSERDRPCDEIRKGYFRLSAGSHVLFYKRLRNGIDVKRILHQRMDFERHL